MRLVTFSSRHAALSARDKEVGAGLRVGVELPGEKVIVDLNGATGQPDLTMRKVVRRVRARVRARG
jgi:hypothetical protein